MQMTPTEYENIIRRLFEARGLTSLTSKQAGADDGIDLVMLHRDPILGGSTVVQAKKYSRVVGVSHIRELIGRRTG
jgi:restriction system protein